jgi:acetolactate synthase-1/2/3 large subunit
MNGAESLMRTARQAGIEMCFANPGTTELQLVAALDTVGGVHAVLGLFEGVCTGAADGYARMTGRPALTLLHLGPGLAHGLSNLHNARRARSAVVNVVGDYATWHRPFDPPLASDIESFARPVSAWLRTSRTAADLSADMAAAIEAALRPPGQVATLIVPQDCAWDAADSVAAPRPRPQPKRVPDSVVQGAATALRAPGGALFLGGTALRETGLRAAARIAATTSCPVWQETLPARIEEGSHLPALTWLPYFPEDALKALKDVRTLVLAGAAEPVTTFGYQGLPSRFAPKDCTVLTLARPDEDVPQALEALAAAVGAPAAAIVAPRDVVARSTGELNTSTLGQALAALQPEGAIIVDEAVTTRLGYRHFAHAAPPHTVLCIAGGSLGQGLPCAVGAALACPERKVIAFEADGSGMYTVQALWTMAREGLDITTVICANRRYRILQIEMARAGIADPGPRAQALTDLSRPSLDWVSLAKGFGVPGARVETADALVTALERALAEPGPALIEAIL